MNRRISGLCAFVALTIIGLYLMGGFFLDAPQHAAESLANRRIHILNNAFQGRITENTAKQNLRQLESGALLAQDLQALKHLEETGETSSAAEETMCLGKIKRIKQKKKYYEYITYEAELASAQRGGEELLRYNLVIKKIGDAFTLTVFEPAKV